MSLPLQAAPLVLIGAGGHARVVLATLRALGLAVRGVCDPALLASGTSQWSELPVLGDDSWILAQAPHSIRLANGIGQRVRDSTRERIQNAFTSRGFEFPALLHPAAWAAPGTGLAAGCHVMAGAVIQPNCRIGTASIVNTRASVDHDGVIGEHVHIAPGATLCGGVSVGHGSFIGSGAVVLPGVQIGDGVVVAAGAVVRRDLASGSFVRPVTSPPL